MSRWLIPLRELVIHQNLISINWDLIMDQLGHECLIKDNVLIYSKTLDFGQQPAKMPPYYQEGLKHQEHIRRFAASY